MPRTRQFRDFGEFYAYYLAEHSDPTTRRLHVCGTIIGCAIVLAALVRGPWWLVAFAPLPGYALAWVGHFFFEHNQPATFSHPLRSFLADFVMCRDVLTGRIRW